MREYLSFFAQAIFWFIPFTFILVPIFNIIQLPFAIIHRYAVYAVLTYKTYLLCQYFSLMTLMGIQNFNISPTLPLIIFSIILLWFNFGSIGVHNRYSDEGDNQHANYYHFFSGIISVPALVILFKFKIYFLYQPIIWYFSLTEWLLDIPILGTIFNFIFYYAAGMFLLAVAGYLIYVITFAIAALIVRRKNTEPTSAHMTEPTSAPRQADTVLSATFRRITDEYSAKIASFGVINPSTDNPFTSLSELFGYGATILSYKTGIPVKELSQPYVMEFRNKLSSERYSNIPASEAENIVTAFYDQQFAGYFIINPDTGNPFQSMAEFFSYGELVRASLKQVMEEKTASD